MWFANGIHHHYSNDKHTPAFTQTYFEGLLKEAGHSLQPDVLAATRRHAVWWGLLGGGALLVAVVLRPVLSRRSR